MPRGLNRIDFDRWYWYNIFKSSIHDREKDQLILPERNEIITLEAARGIAAVLVVTFHANLLCNAAGLRPLDSFFAFGDSAVDFFFVLSGFIITWVHRSHWGKPGQAGSYLWRRFARIYPAYWAATLMVALPFVLIPWTRGVIMGQGTEYVAQNILLAPTQGFLIIPPAWTLQHEVLFYVLFSSLIISRSGGLIVILAWIAGMFWVNIVTGCREFPYTFLFSPLNMQFVIGMISALLVARIGRLTGLILLVFGGLWFFGLSIIQVKTHWLSNVFVSYPYGPALMKGIAGAFMIIGMVAIETFYHFRRLKLLSFIGTASYSMYLVHLPCMVSCLLALIATGMIERLSAETIFAVLAIYGITAGMVFHRIAEKPLLNFVRGVKIRGL